MTFEERNELEKAMLGRGIKYETIALVLKDFQNRMSNKYPYQKIIKKPQSGYPAMPSGWAGDPDHASRFAGVSKPNIGISPKPGFAGIGGGSYVAGDK